MSKMRIFYTLALLLVLARSLWLWQFPSSLPDKEIVVPPALPLLAKMLNHDVREQILAHNLWQQDRGLQKTPKALKLDSSVQPSQWTLMAVGEAGKKKMAMIRAKHKIAMYYVDDVLPDGRKILKILLDGVLVRGKGEKASEYVYLFGKGS